VCDKVWPTEKTGTFCKVVLVVSLRASLRVSILVRTNLSPYDPARFAVNEHTPHISVTHRVYLRTRSRRSGFEKISFRDCVGSVRLWVNAKNLPSKVVGVGRGSLIVEVFTTRAFICLGKQTVAGVVSYREIQIAIFIPGSSSPG